MSASEPPPSTRFLKWLWFGATALVAFMATVKVEDARSNVAGWLHFLGVDQVPALLASANTDWIALVSAFFSSLGALAYTTHVAREALDGVEYIGPGSSYLKRTKIQEPKEVPGGERHKDQNDGFH